ncbi:MAG: hypothetical protein KC547_15840 [Anaerolineae bacterium]|nr:hypothetical protein [Anaerolineae bacterium]
MDLARLTEVLTIPAESTFVVLGLDVQDWGRVLRLPCRYTTPDGASGAFALIFDDCREMRWRLYTHYQGDTPALVDLTLGTAAHRKPAHILTDAFGISLLYGEFRVTRSPAA